MAIINFFSKEERAGAEPQMQDGSVILAYMEELARTRAALQLWFHEDDRVGLATQVLAVDDNLLRMRLRLHRSLPSDIVAKQKVTLVFGMEGSRFLCPIRFLTRGAYLEAWFTVPETVVHAERRTKLRTHFSLRERATVTVLEALHDQCGATGALLDLSLEGLCMRLDRVVSVRDKRALEPSAGMFPPGTRFPVLRIEQLPFAPALECSGVVAHTRDTGEGVTLGIRFEGLGDLGDQILNQVMSRRLPTFNQGFPVRKRIEAVEAAAADREAAVGITIQRLEAAAEPEAVAALTEAEVKAERQHRLLLMKKKAKRLLLILFDDLDRAILGATLKVDGYEKILEARNYLEALAHCKVFPLDLILIEQQLGTHTAQAFLEKLRKQGVCLEVPVVLLADQLDVRVKIMAKAAGIDHIQKVPIDYDGQLREKLNVLLKLGD